MPTEHCPSCHTLRTVPDPAGQTKTILTRTFHRETCPSFGRSEEEDEIQRVD